MQWSNKVVLVAGSTGLIGKHLTNELVKKGARVRATWHKRIPEKQLEGVEYVQADLTQGEACQRAVKGANYVYLCAAHTPAASLLTHPLQQLNSNVLISTHMLAEAYAAGVEKFIDIGSTVAYPPSPQPVHEDSLWDGEPFEKYAFVGWGKRYSEILCRMYGEKLEKRMPCIVLRPTNVYGPGDNFDFATSRFLPALIRRVVERHKPLVVWGNGHDVRDMVFIDDVVEALLLAAEKIPHYRTFNIGMGKGYSVREALELILRIDGYSDASIVYDQSKPSMIPIRLVNVERAKTELGFQARTSLEEGITRTLSWYKSELDRTR